MKNKIAMILACVLCITGITQATDILISFRPPPLTEPLQAFMNANPRVKFDYMPGLWRDEQDPCREPAPNPRAFEVQWFIDEVLSYDAGFGVVDSLDQITVDLEKYEGRRDIARQIDLLMAIGETWPDVDRGLYLGGRAYPDTAEALYPHTEVAVVAAGYFFPNWSSERMNLTYGHIVGHARAAGLEICIAFSRRNFHDNPEGRVTLTEFRTRVRTMKDLHPDKVMMWLVNQGTDEDVEALEILLEEFPALPGESADGSGLRVAESDDGGTFSPTILPSERPKPNKKLKVTAD